MAETSIVDFTNYRESVFKAFDDIGAKEVLKSQSKILIKPNCVDKLQFPITTNPDCCVAIIDYIRQFSDNEIIIAEGCGSSYSTTEVFDFLGYTKISEQKNIKLIDLNTQPLSKLSNKNCKIIPDYYIPSIAMEYFIVSVPVLKAHSLSDVTLSLKNMMGFAPPKYYQRGGSWKKSFFHAQMQQSILEINSYRTSDLTLLDASIGMQDYHLGGNQCFPPINKIVASFDPSETDKIGCKLLGINWKQIKHIADYQQYKPTFSMIKK